ncbi:hypothetical protein FISHEDRAFT_77723 [Fistulina hepatica ATCC 64428]|nr:hypothetical protein FISHEDRAFT_77723 [Fistulina hepatica ATCC 64428]
MSQRCVFTLFERYAALKYKTTPSGSHSLPKTSTRQLSTFNIRSHSKNGRRIAGEGARNLRDRYVRLEKSVRAKSALTSSARNATISANKHLTPSSSLESRLPESEATGASSSQTTFMGLVIPEEPAPPADDECCMSGCAVCVYDLYEDARSAYKDSLKRVQDRLVGMGISASSWPEALQLKQHNNIPARTTTLTRNAIADAFEEMERALAAKRTVP